MIGYFLSTFPTLSTTFIQREVKKMESLGLDLTYISTRTPKSDDIHPEDTEPPVHSPAPPPGPDFADVPRAWHRRTGRRAHRLLPGRGELKARARTKPAPGPPLDSGCPAPHSAGRIRMTG